MKKKSSSKIRESFGLFLVYSWFIFEINQISFKSFGHWGASTPALEIEDMQIKINLKGKYLFRAVYCREGIGYGSMGWYSPDPPLKNNQINIFNGFRIWISYGSGCSDRNRNLIRPIWNPDPGPNFVKTIYIKWIRIPSLDRCGGYIIKHFSYSTVWPNNIYIFLDLSLSASCRVGYKRVSVPGAPLENQWGHGMKIKYKRV